MMYWLVLVLKHCIPIFDGWIRVLVKHPTRVEVFGWDPGFRCQDILAYVKIGHPKIGSLKPHFPDESFLIAIGRLPFWGIPLFRPICLAIPDVLPDESWASWKDEVPPRCTPTSSWIIRTNIPIIWSQKVPHSRVQLLGSTPILHQTRLYI